MLKETETEEARLFYHIFIIGGILIGGEAGHLVPALTTPMAHHDPCVNDPDNQTMLRRSSRTRRPPHRLT